MGSLMDSQRLGRSRVLDSAISDLESLNGYSLPVVKDYIKRVMGILSVCSPEDAKIYFRVAGAALDNCRLNGRLENFVAKT